MTLMHFHHDSLWLYEPLHKRRCLWWCETRLKRCPIVRKEWFPCSLFIIHTITKFFRQTLQIKKLRHAEPF
jgi:hypothetical protein